MQVLVYGFYNSRNIGDRLFKLAFQKLFPEYQFTFTDVLTLELLQKFNIIFFGGGSFLDAPINMKENLFPILLGKKIFYIGVGVETDIHSQHLELMKKATLIASRNSSHFVSSLKGLVIPDLVYALETKNYQRKNKSVLILPNAHLISTNSDKLWKYNAWEYFKSEFSQFIDYLIDEKYNISFLPMCEDKNINDVGAAFEIINRLNKKEYTILSPNIEEVLQLISTYSIVITQRFHGIVLSEITHTPYISIHHHDKLQYTYPKNGNYISYYNLNKNLLINNFKNINKFELNREIKNKFSELKNKVSQCLDLPG